jgi:hypothetical protein
MVDISPLAMTRVWVQGTRCSFLGQNPDPSRVYRIGFCFVRECRSCSVTLYRLPQIRVCEGYTVVTRINITMVTDMIRSLP